jgi:hypothetical protein
MRGEGGPPGALGVLVPTESPPLLRMVLSGASMSVVVVATLLGESRGRPPPALSTLVQLSSPPPPRPARAPVLLLLVMPATSRGRASARALAGAEAGCCGRWGWGGRWRWGGRADAAGLLSSDEAAVGRRPGLEACRRCPLPWSAPSHSGGTTLLPAVADWENGWPRRPAANAASPSAPPRSPDSDPALGLLRPRKRAAKGPLDVRCSAGAPPPPPAVLREMLRKMRDARADRGVALRGVHSADAESGRWWRRMGVASTPARRRVMLPPPAAAAAPAALTRAGLASKRRPAREVDCAWKTSFASSKPCAWSCVGVREREGGLAREVVG